MDAPTYEQLTPPAIIRQVSGQSNCESLEKKVWFNNEPQRKSIAFISKILRELKRPLEISHYEKETGNGTVVNELRFDPITKNLVAGFYYYADGGDRQKLDRVIYISNEGIPVVLFYYKGTAAEHWHDPKKVSNVYFDRTRSLIQEPGERCKHIQDIAGQIQEIEEQLIRNEQERKRIEEQWKRFEEHKKFEERRMREWLEEELEKWRRNEEGAMIFT